LLLCTTPLPLNGSGGPNFVQVAPASALLAKGEKK
jgi:hypothetical protein